MFAIRSTKTGLAAWKAPALLLMAVTVSTADLPAQSKIVVDTARRVLLQRMPVLEAASSIKASAYPGHVYLRWTCPSGSTAFDVYVTPAGGQQTKANSTPISAQCVLDVPSSLRQPGRLPDPIGTNAPNTNTYSTSFQHNGLRAKQEYAYVVRTLYPNGAADAQPIVVVTPPWPAPTGVQLRVEHQPPPVSGSHVTVTWNAVQGAPGYEVWATSLYEGQPNRLVTSTPVAGTTFTDTSPIGVKGYFVKTVDGLASPPVDVTWY